MCDVPQQHVVHAVRVVMWHPALGAGHRQQALRRCAMCDVPQQHVVHAVRVVMWHPALGAGHRQQALRRWATCSVPQQCNHGGMLLCMLGLGILLWELATSSKPFAGGQCSMCPANT
jgi:hypothetical protein